jgi:hypothetical protein
VVHGLVTVATRSGGTYCPETSRTGRAVKGGDTSGTRLLRCEPGPTRPPLPAPSVSASAQVCWSALTTGPVVTQLVTHPDRRDPQPADFVRAARRERLGVSPSVDACRVSCSSSVMVTATYPSGRYSTSVDRVHFIDYYADGARRRRLGMPATLCTSHGYL